MQSAGMDLLQLPSAICRPPGEGLSGHWATGEAQNIEGDSSFQPIGHRGWIRVHMPCQFLLYLIRETCRKSLNLVFNAKNIYFSFLLIVS